MCPCTACVSAPERPAAARLAPNRNDKSNCSIPSAMLARHACAGQACMLVGSQSFNLRTLLSKVVVDRLVTGVLRGFQTASVARTLSAVFGEVLCLPWPCECSCMCMSHARAVLCSCTGSSVVVQCVALRVVTRWFAKLQISCPTRRIGAYTVSNNNQSGACCVIMKVQTAEAYI